VGRTKSYLFKSSLTKAGCAHAQTLKTLPFNINTLFYINMTLNSWTSRHDAEYGDFSWL